MRAVLAAREFLVRHGAYRSASALMTVAATLRSREPVRMDFDGRDWCLHWGGDRTLYSEDAWTDPRSLTERYLPLFFHGYRPEPGDTVLVCGAGIGTEVRALSDLVGPRGRVVAIEAGPQTCRRLSRMVADLPIANVVVVEAAVSDWTGRGRFTAAAAADGTTCYLLKATTATVTDHEVAVDTLAGIVEALGIDRIDHLQMNTEGEERSALAGLGPAVSMVRNVCASCHDFTGRPEARTHEEVSRYLSDHGFVVSGYADALPGSAESYYVFARRVATHSS